MLTSCRFCAQTAFAVKPLLVQNGRRSLAFSAPFCADSLTPEQQAQIRSGFRHAQNRGPQMGPFPAAQLDNSDDTDYRRMRDLSAGGKIARLGSKSGQWLFVAFGLSVGGLVAYSTLSELFAKNSPTRLYEQATERIQQSPEIRSILGDRLVFYGDHPSARKRRSHRVQHTLQPDSRTGRQTMTLTFWVESKQGEDVPWYIRARTWLHELVWEPSDHGGPPLIVEPPSRQPVSSISREAASPSSWWNWLFGGFFSAIAASLRGNNAAKQKRPAKPTKPVLGQFTSGEATAILKQNVDGRFVFHSLTVDVPERGKGNWRVWVVSPQKYNGRRR